MSEVTREDVAEQLFYAARRDDWGVANDEEKAEFFESADALIAAFPHLVGEVVEIDTEHSMYDLRIQEVYKVYAPWREAGR